MRCSVTTLQNTSGDDEKRAKKAFSRTFYSCFLSPRTRSFLYGHFVASRPVHALSDAAVEETRFSESRKWPKFLSVWVLFHERGL